MKIRAYTEADEGAWDELVAAAPMGSFLHSRKFLSYHGDRFVDASLVMLDDAGHLRAVLPAVLDPSDSTTVVSHAGATFGGVIHLEDVTADETLQLLAAGLEFYRQAGRSTLVYKCVPFHVPSRPSSADQYALWRLGAKLYRRDLWNVVDLNEPRLVRMARLRRRRMARASNAGLTAVREVSDPAYAEFHRILVGNLTRHGVSPVHSVAEMTLLRDRFPEHIDLWLVRDPDGAAVAGGWFFRYSPRTWHAQYISTTEAGRECSANDQLIEQVMASAKEEGVRYFSFGSSTEQEGRVLNAGLYAFKSSFGFGSVVQDFYRFDLSQPHDTSG